MPDHTTTTNANINSISTNGVEVHHQKLFPGTPMFGTSSNDAISFASVAGNTDSDNFSISTEGDDDDADLTSLSRAPTFFSKEELDRQREEIDQAKKSALAARISNLQTHAALAVPGTVRARLLMTECYRNELRRVADCRQQGYLTHNQESAAIMDIATGYGSMLHEVANTLRMKVQQGCSQVEEQNLANQAIQRIASLYPWSDSILTDLPPMDAVALSSRRQARRGETGKIIPLSLGATTVCSQAKNSESNEMRNQVLIEAEDIRQRWVAEEEFQRQQQAAAAAAAAMHRPQQQQEGVTSGVSSGTNSAQTLSPSSNGSSVGESHDEEHVSYSNSMLNHSGSGEMDDEDLLNADDATACRGTQQSSIAHVAQVQVSVCLDSPVDTEEEELEAAAKEGSPMGMRQDCIVF